MTRPAQSALVLDGNEDKLRLQAERLQTGSAVHVDWVRFTCKLKNSPDPTVDDLFPRPVQPHHWLCTDDEEHRRIRLAKLLKELPDADFCASAQAKTLGDQVCEVLGPDFYIYPEVRKGHDFYRFRLSIVRNDHEVGWVGYLASGDSPRQQAQAQTLHVNLYGAACTFALPGFADRLASLIDSTQASITRVDLALDFFDGITGGMERIRDDYMAGAMDHWGHRPACNLVGDWCNGRSRSFYFGSKEAGKQTNIYEKGHQLYGPKSSSLWQRVELRYGNKKRELPSDILRRPADFFAGASAWHSSILAEADTQTQATPETIKTTPRLAAETVQAEVSRVLRWARETAGPSLSFLVQHATEDQLFSVCDNKKLPGRLQRFNPGELQKAASQLIQKFTGSGLGQFGNQPA